MKKETHKNRACSTHQSSYERLGSVGFFVSVVCCYVAVVVDVVDDDDYDDDENAILFGQSVLEVHANSKVSVFLSPFFSRSTLSLHFVFGFFEAIFWR